MAQSSLERERTSGLAASVADVDQMKLPENDRRRGWPAPTVLIDGRDLFGLPEPTGPAMGCRMYKDGAPSFLPSAPRMTAVTRSPSSSWR